MDDDAIRQERVPGNSDPDGRVLDASELRRVARQQIAVAAERAAAFKGAVRPIWMANSKGRPTHVGSSVLVEIGTGFFILTAAHVSDEARKSTLYIGGAELLPLPSGSEATVASGGIRDQDVVDFAFLRFPDDLADRLGDAVFIPEALIGVAEPIATRTFTCLGYPNSKNRDPYWGATAVRGKLMSYTSRGRPCSALASRAIEGVHVLVDRNPKFVRNPDGVRIRAGRANGFSGGAIFDVGALGTVEEVLSPSIPRLAAIFTEAHRGEKVIMGTRVDYMVAELRRRGHF